MVLEGTETPSKRLDQENEMFPSKASITALAGQVERERQAAVKAGDSFAAARKLSLRDHLLFKSRTV
jgi:hypothetical protein